MRAALFLALVLGCSGGGKGVVDGAGGGGSGGTAAPADAGVAGSGGGSGVFCPGEIDPRAAASCDPAPGVDAGAVSFDGGGCGAVIEHHRVEGCAHMECGGTFCYRTRPPSSGVHAPYWPDYRAYAAPVAWPNLVHALEHGAVVIVYNCPGGCADEIARAQALIDGLPVDPLCDGETDRRRIILAPDPTLDVRWGASAWTWTLRAACFDEEAFGTFLLDHYGHGLEATCFEGHPTAAQLCPAP